MKLRNLLKITDPNVIVAIIIESVEFTVEIGQMEVQKALNVYKGASVLNSHINQISILISQYSGSPILQIKIKVV